MLGGSVMRFPTVVVRGDVLSSWLTITDYTKSQLAAELAISRGRVSQLLTSSEEPSAHLIAKLMTLTRLPFDRLFKMVQHLPEPSASASGGNGKRSKAARERTSSRAVRRDRVLA